MANIDTLDSLGHISKEEGVNSSQEEKGAEGSSKKAAADEVAAVSKPSSPAKDAAPALPSPGSGLVSLKGSALNGVTPGGSGAPALSMPHPKKFSHSDINKRFLEKNSPASSASQTPSTPTVNKPGNAPQKPALQTAPSHSRLVTAKLTAEGQRATITGPGWSRPPSTSSSSGPPATAGATSKPSPGPVPGGIIAPLPAPVGKVIQPQPRGLADGGVGKKDGASKPAWGAAAKPPPAIIGNLEDFPTAAEVAQVRSAKMMEKKQATQAATAHKEALATEADAFRGVHLAPNVHHWDEDEGDDSNFLDEVIEFDDGRQYTIPHQQAEQRIEGAPSVLNQAKESEDQPVSKEERFANDIDRRWPRSRNAPQRGRLSPSTASSHSILHSPQDSSRVLFNERSNRLEPYSSHTQGRYGGPQKDYFTRRGSRSEYVTSPTESRSSRDAPPHTQGPQLLQRGGSGNGFSEDGMPPRHRGFGDHTFTPWHDNGRPRDRDNAGPSHMSRTYSQAFDHNRSRDHYTSPVLGPDRQRRFSNIGLPSPGDLENRQLPPHLSGTQPSPSMWRSPSSETSRQLPTVESPQTPASRSPAATQASLSPLHVDSPLQASSAAPPLMDIEEVSRTAMHNAAERARLRRQQEEEEREKEKERARRKAAEIEAKMKAAEEAKVTHEQGQHEREEGAPTGAADKAEAEAVQFIEHAVGSITLNGEQPPEEKAMPYSATASKPTFARAPSIRGGIRPGFMRRGSSSIANGDAPAAETDSWRSKPPSSRPPRTPNEPTTPSQPPSIPPPKLPLLAEVESFNIEAGDSVEVVDFADHGKLIGVHETLPSTETQPSERSVGPSTRPPRPVATDFFDDKAAPRSAPPQATNNEGSWRRGGSIADQTDKPVSKPQLEITPTPFEPTSPSVHWKGPLSEDISGRAQPEYGPAGHHASTYPSLRSPTTPSYREAPMSALTDTMARIKGALDGMHHKSEPPKKWVPPALREPPPSAEKPEIRHEHDEHMQREIFDVTGYEPPRSPKPAWNHFMVRLPRTSRAVEPIAPKRLRLFGSPSHVRLDVYSFVPPIEGMHRRDFQLNEYLFRRPFMSKGRVRYIVSLPGSRISGQASSRQPGPIVNLPANGRNSSAGAFGRPSEADGVASWRRPASSKVETRPSEVSGTLDTVSRSPPPEVPSRKFPDRSEVSAPAPAGAPAKGRLQPKLPEGSSVAFYRDSRVNSSESQPKPTVNFIVNSELEEDAPRRSEAGDLKTNGISAMSQPPPTGLVTTTQEASIIVESCSSVNDPIVEFRKSNHSPIHAPITPRSQTGNPPWQKSPKDSLSKDFIPRTAETEHLKTVWSTTANQTDKPSSNSLLEIANDLAVPMPVRDTKLEETVTPSPHPMHPSKISLSDVTRSFQQVPTSSGSSSSTDVARSTVAPQPTSPPTFRQPTQMPGQPQPPMMQGMRPPYTGYPSPMLSSPSPSMMYAQAMTPSPIPRPMVPATSSQYPAPMWMPMAPPGMMRPMPSPYGAQLMPYPPTAPMYAPMNMQGNNPAQPNGAQGRPPGMMMSPVAAPAQPNMPMYATSPVLMSAMPAMQSMSGVGYPGPSNGRGQPPQRGTYDGMMQQASFGPQAPSPYSTAPPNSYLRSTW